MAHPVNARTQEEAASRRQADVADYVETLYSWSAPVRGELLLVAGACGTSGTVVHAGERHAVWTYPLPERRLERALTAAGGIDVWELGGAVVAGKVRSMLSSRPVRSRDGLSGIDHSQHYRVSDAYETLFEALRSFQDRIICGDLGSYTMDPARTIDICLCYGAALPVAAGCALAAPDMTVFCVTGDAALMHSGQACMREVLVRGVRVVLIVIDNGRAQSTGGQIIPGAFDLPAGLTVAEVEYAHASVATYRQVLARLAARTSLSVLRVRC